MSIPVEQPSSRSAGSGESRRQLGWGSATAIVMASMIGTGVFTTSGFLLSDLKSRSWVLWAWAVGGLIAIMGSACYGALARRIPESGGEYVFLSRTLHPAAGWMAGWLSIFVGFAAPLAAAAHAFGIYTEAWWPIESPRITGTLLMVVFAVAHAWHVQRGAALQNTVVVLKLVALLIFLVAGFMRLPAVEAPTESAAAFSLGAFSVALVWISFSYSGWNAAVYLGGEVVEPEKNLPRAMMAGTLGVMIIYVLLNGVMIHAAPMEQLANQLDIGLVASRALGGSAWATGVTALVATALVTTVSSMIMIGSRVCARMAEDGYLPPWLASVSGPPRLAILFQALLALALLWSLTFESLLTYIGFTLGLSTAATVVGLIVLRRRAGSSMAVPGWPWLPVLFVTCVLSITGFTMVRQPMESALGLATLGLGWAVWRFGAFRRRM